MTRIFIVSVFLLSGIAMPQQQDYSKTADSLVQDAVGSYKSRQYKKAIDSFLKAAARPEAKNFIENIYYNVSCCYSLLGQPQEALDFLDKTVAAGYTDYRYISNDPDLYFLVNNYPGRFNAILSKARYAQEKIRITMSPIAVIVYDNYGGPIDMTKYFWDDFKHPKMDSLRLKYRLQKIVEQGQTEFGKMKLLLNWVATRWRHNGNNTCKVHNALAILDAAEKGETFACVDYSIVLTQCLTVLGYPARSVGLWKLGVAYGNAKGHRCTEVWSNQYGKWILLDGQNNGWWESGGVPLSAQECRHLYVKGKDGELKFVGQHKDIDYASIKPQWSDYFHHIILSCDNAYFDPAPKGRGPSFEFLADSVSPELFSEGWPVNLPAREDNYEAYPSLNQTAIRLLHQNDNSPSDTLLVELKNTTPFFDRYLVRIDGSGWRVSASNFVWVLNKGENSLQAKAINLAGVEGRTSRIVLRNNIDRGKK